MGTIVQNVSFLALSRGVSLSLISRARALSLSLSLFLARARASLSLARSLFLSLNLCHSIPAPFYANEGYQVQGYEGYQVLRNPTYSEANAHTTGPTGPSNQKYASYNGPMMPAGYEGYQIEDFSRRSRTSQGVEL